MCKCDPRHTNVQCWLLVTRWSRGR